MRDQAPERCVRLAQGSVPREGDHHVRAAVRIGDVRFPGMIEAARTAGP